MEQVGYETYTKLLEENIRELKGEEIEKEEKRFEVKNIEIIEMQNIAKMKIKITGEVKDE